MRERLDSMLLCPCRSLPAAATSKCDSGARHSPRRTPRIDRYAAIAIALAAALLIGACTTLPAALDAPKTTSSAFAQPETTTIGKQVAARAKGHAGLSGFHLLLDGTNTF